MGLMKRVYTEWHQNKSLVRFAPGEREAIRNLIRTSEGLLRFLAEEAAPPPTAGGIPLDEVFLRMSFTGFKPERVGVYLVVDLVSETQRVVQLDRVDKRWLVSMLGESRPSELSEFSRDHFRWFLISDLGQDDLDFIRKQLTPLALS